jgi:hypothetical protein
MRSANVKFDSFQQKTNQKDSTDHRLKDAKCSLMNNYDYKIYRAEDAPRYQAWMPVLY